MRILIVALCGCSLIAGCGRSSKTRDLGDEGSDGGAIGSVDAGPGQDSGPMAGEDAGPGGDATDAGEVADSGIASTTFYSDAGVMIVRYDYDAGTDCDGVVPAAEDLTVATATFPAQPEGCAPPLADEAGVIALGTRGVPPIGEYALFTNDSDARLIGAFVPDAPQTELHAEPAGFSRAELDGGWTFTLFDGTGAAVAVARRDLAPADTSGVSPLPSGGYALVVGGDASSQYLLQTVTVANGWRLSDPVVLDVADGGVMGVALRASEEGNLLLSLRNWDAPPARPNRWYQPDGSPLTEWFEGYPQVLSGTYTVLGGVVFDIPESNGGWPDYYSFVPDPVAAPAKIPAMYLNWSIVRGARAYANWGQVCFPNGTCFRDPDQVDLLSRSGLQCGSLYFEPHGNIFIGRDGTVVQQNGCSYRWYPQALK